MIEASNKKVLLEKTPLGFENEGVFNPATYKSPTSDTVHLFYRAVRVGNYSSIGYCKLDGSTTIINRLKKPLIFPEEPYESQGVEDPRLVKIEDKYYLTYSAYNNVNVLGAYATSKDLKSFKKHGIITPKLTYREYKHFVECNSCSLNEKYLFHYKVFKEHGLGPEVASKLYMWDKNLMLFPRKINGKYALLHRIFPGIQIVYFQSFNELTKEFWEDYLMNLEKHIVLDPRMHYESSHIGGGCPPIETPEGWLLIYHAGEATPSGFKYHASAALLDLNTPEVELSRLSHPLISPTLKWEKEGVVNNIVFPSGTAIFGDNLYIYYGAADERVGIARVSLHGLISELLNQKKPHHEK